MYFADEKDRPLSSQLVRAKADRGKVQESGPTDLSAIESEVDAGHYDTLAKFDADVNSLLNAVMRENGRLSTLGSAAAQIKKVRMFFFFKLDMVNRMFIVII